MLPVASAELAQLRAEVASAACDTQCIVKRATKTADGYGTSTEVYNVVTTVNVGLKQPTAGQAHVYAYLIGSSVAWQVWFPVGTDVKSGDHLFIGTDVMVVQAVLSLQSYSTLDLYLATEIK